MYVSFRKIFGLFLTLFLGFSLLNATPASAGNEYNIQQVRARYDDAIAKADAARKDLVAARKRVKTAGDESMRLLGDIRTLKKEETAASVVFAEKQTQFEEVVRSMYMSGMSNGILDVVVSAGEGNGDGFVQALTTQDYLESVAGYSYGDVDTARNDLALATAKVESAKIAYDNAMKEVTDAAIALEAEETEYAVVAEEEVAAKTAFEDYMNNFSPSTGELLLGPDDAGCSNWLVRLLYRAGFRGENLREAWAIAMRESGGNEKSISSSQDYGVFQFNKPTWGSQDWWDDEAVLTREYNVAVAYRLSDGGRNWLPWGLDGQGRANPLVYQRSGWSPTQIEEWIIKPYVKWYNLYPCVDVQATQNDAVETEATGLLPGVIPTASKS